MWLFVMLILNVALFCTVIILAMRLHETSKANQEIRALAREAILTAVEWQKKEPGGWASGERR